MQYITKNTYLDITGVSITDNLDQCLAYCSSKKVIAIDTETSGLNFLTDKLLLFQIGDSNAQFVIDCTTISLHPLIPLLLDASIQKVFHNVKFDYKFIRKALDIQIENVYDTMLVEAVIHCGKKNMSKSLAATAERHLGITMSKAEQNSFIGLNSGRFTLSQLEYAAKDIEVLLEIKDSQARLVLEYKLEKVCMLENYASLAFADIEYNGIGVDKDTWILTAKSVEREVYTLEEELYQMILTDPLFIDFIPKNYNLSLFDTMEGSRIESLKKNLSFSSLNKY